MPEFDKADSAEQYSKLSLSMGRNSTVRSDDEAATQLYGFGPWQTASGFNQTVCPLVEFCPLRRGGVEWIH